MASGIFTVLDDIAVLMDDVAIASKVAAQKTAGILGDDLAVNAEKATGFVSSREIPVLWAITKGSMLNKVIIIPLIFLLNYYSPFSIKVILVIGGLYLAYEGVEKIVEYLFHRKERSRRVESIEEPMEEDSESEALKVKAAIKTDFILSLEIIIIALGTVLDEPWAVQLMTVIIIALLATVGVYGLVALVVRMDDAGYWLISKSKKLEPLGKILIRTLPRIIQMFSVVGTLALLAVSGGIFAHNINWFLGVFTTWPALLKEMFLGSAIGLLVFLIILIPKKIKSV